MNFIKGTAQVIMHFGGWPTFHNADYLLIYLDMDGPTVSIDFRLYNTSKTTGIAYSPSISLVWHEVQEFNLSGVRALGQNSVKQMHFTKTDEGITTTIEPAGDGTTVTLRAKSVEVTNFDPIEEWDYEKSNTASD